MDVFSPEKRSAIMAAVRQTGTRPELRVRQVATAAGLRYRIAPAAIQGRPDLSFPGAKTAVFVHGCFWHRHDGCKRTTTPSSNIDFWQRKFDRNVQRDEAVRQALADRGWQTVAIWECETKDATTILERLVPVIEHYRPDAS
jgi:DNA mismatch endonuclease (patch repair protein)